MKLLLNVMMHENCSIDLSVGQDEPYSAAADILCHAQQQRQDDAPLLCNHGISVLQHVCMPEERFLQGIIEILNSVKQS